MNRRVRVVLMALLLISAAACDDETSEPPGTAAPTPPSGTGPTILGTERLAWDQAADSYQSLLQYSFALYVDGARTPLAGVECIDSAAASGYSCSSRLPPLSNGTHILELSAIVNGMESARSSRLTVNVGQGRTVVDSAGLIDASTHEQAAPLCVAGGSCFEVTRLVSGGAPLTSPAATPDGRLLFIEDGRHVRVLDAGVVSGESAFSLSEDDARLVALLVDPSFEQTGFVRLAWIEQTRDGPSLVIARLRESNNRLVEPMVIVAPMELAAGREPRVAQDDQGRIYVAMPGDGSATRNGRDLYAGSLLRFGSSGLTWSEGLGTPPLADGSDQPRALTFDPRTRRLWLAGADRDRRGNLISIRLGERGSDPSGPPELYIAPSASEAIVSLAPVGFGPVPDFLALDAAGRLSSAAAESSALRIRGYLPFEWGAPLTIDAGMRGGVLVTARSSDVALVPSFSIFVLRPQGPR